jgi:Uma2 family endonuclease
MVGNVVAHSSPILTEEEYLSFERSSNVRHEYLSGHIYAIAGATREHNLITGNVAGELRAQLKGKPCETYSNDMRVWIPRAGQYTYPDVVVVCGTPQFLDDQADTLLNPLVIIEVLSSSTEAYDRGEKFRDYRSIESFSEYVLISQAKRGVDHFTKVNNIWTIQEVEQEIRFVTIPCRLTFSDIYDRVEFGQG